MAERYMYSNAGESLHRNVLTAFEWPVHNTQSTEVASKLEIAVVEHLNKNS